ncbi:hypothetical protein HBE96_05105 [Clostridium sp. P21]|uniref:Stage III sporulation protein AC n=1 Tax=Clostridium muellerianum TaxID=2716538 RepID=A0A7Y0EER1_9CLOT|nr:hypothetical protein [Clostridium muellerianum]NMM62077.1 hypothetical protein [Clostridium muellerianum]
MVKVLAIGIIKTGAITLVLSKAMRTFGKQDYADVIKFSGICLIGINVMQIVAYIIQHPPGIIKVICNIISFFS